MQIRDAQSIRQLALVQLRDPETVRVVSERIRALEPASTRRAALGALVDRLLEAEQLEAAVRVADLAPALTPATNANDVDPWFESALLLRVVDSLLERQELSRAEQLLDKAAHGLSQLSHYEPVDLPADPPWSQLTRRYLRAALPDRVDQIWDQVVAWARSIEQGRALPDPAWFQPADGSRLLAGIVAEMLQLGHQERARATANAICHEPYRAQALALLRPTSTVSAPDARSDTLIQVREVLARRRRSDVERAADLARAAELLAEPGLARLHERATSAAALGEQTRRELVALLAALDRPGAELFTLADRMRAGQALGLLGDPRFPLLDEEWLASLNHLRTSFTADGDHYWRYVPAGSYWLGGWAAHDHYAGPLQRDQWVVQLALASFWIARLPVTVSQFARFVAEGYHDDSCWTPNGLRWRAGRAAPNGWGLQAYHGANQPVVFVSWYEATAFCRWLTARLGPALPEGYTLGLPSEAEWEVAATGDGTERRRPYPWGHEPPSPERAVYSAWQLQAPAPVGLCPAGSAACGALDMAGAVWEACGSAAEAYPKWAHTWLDDRAQVAGSGLLPLRGGSWARPSYSLDAGARHSYVPHNGNYHDAGLRLALAARPAGSSAGDRAGND